MLMSGFFCRQFSIAVWPLAWSPKESAMHTTSAGLASSLDLASSDFRPKPCRKPLWRWAPTGWPGNRSSVAILAGLPAVAALAYWPISTPALKLSVANSASVASAGSAGLSRAITITPWARAFWMAGTMALESLGVIRMVLAPAAIMFSIAVTCPALSPSALPAPVSSLAPLALAASWAPSFIFTKKGLVSVLVIRPMTGWLATAAPAAPASGVAMGRARERGMLCRGGR